MAQITVNYDSQTSTFFLTDDTGAKIPGQELINTATDAVNRANALGTEPAKTDSVQSNLTTEKTAAANETASKTDTPPPGNTGNNPTPPAETKDAATPDDKQMTSAGTTDTSTAAKAKDLNKAHETILGPYANPLAKFPSYTYGIVLWMLHPEDFNSVKGSVLDDPTYTGPKAWPGPRGLRPESGVIVASGGKYTTSGMYKRLSDFGLDMFIDDLKFDSFTPAAVKGKGATNEMGGSFTIIEPMGASFFDGLASAVHNMKSSSGASATYTQIPYMLEIDFYGTDENYIVQPKSLADGQLKKRLPILITRVSVNFTSRGTEYKVTFVPYSHVAHRDFSVVKEAGKIENAQTVGEFFSGYNATEKQYYQDANGMPRADLVVETGAVNQNRSKAEIATSLAVTDAENKTGQATTAYDKATKPDTQAEQDPTATPSTGLAFLINKYNASLVTKAKARSQADFVKFVIHPDIAKSKIVNKADLDIKSLPMDVKAVTDPSLLTNSTGLKFDGASYNITAGSSIMELIGQVLRNSDYIQDQIRTPKTPDAPTSGDSSGGSDSGGDKTKDDLYNAPFKWFKVITDVRLREWDEKAGMYQKHVTFFIVPYIVYHTNHPLAPQTVPQGSPYKSYQYLFTGKNTEIIECKLEFNNAFYTLMAVGNQNNLLDSTEASNEDAEKPKGEYPPVNGYKDSSGKFVSVPTVQPRAVQHVINHQPSTTNLGGNRNEKTQIASNVGTALAAAGLANGLTLDMKILGDPQYIKQDELLWNPRTNGYKDPLILPDGALLNMGSLPFDTGEMYVDVNFKSPTDIDYSTGLVIPSLNSSKTNMFSGRFRILRIENQFAKGKFEQVLHLVRYPDQEVQKEKAKTQTATREAPAKQAPAPTAKAPATVNSTTPTPEGVPNAQGVTVPNNGMDVAGAGAYG